VHTDSNRLYGARCRRSGGTDNAVQGQRRRRVATGLERRSRLRLAGPLGPAALHQSARTFSLTLKQHFVRARNEPQHLGPLGPSTVYVNRPCRSFDLHRPTRDESGPTQLMRPHRCLLMGTQIRTDCHPTQSARAGSQSARLRPLAAVRSTAFRSPSAAMIGRPVMRAGRPSLCGPTRFEQTVTPLRRRRAGCDPRRACRRTSCCHLLTLGELVVVTSAN
jgi:hypothetical protein